LITTRHIFLSAAVLALMLAPSTAQTPATERGREIPGYFLPVPDDLSPQTRALVAAPIGRWDIHPKNIEEWKELAAGLGVRAVAATRAMREKLGVAIEPTTIAGVKAFMLTPRTIAPENQNRVFLQFHGGAYVTGSGEAGTREGILMAAFGRAKVISVDYRTSSDAPYPAALDDCVAIYRELLKTVPAQRIGVFGSSAGGGLTMALVLRGKQDGFALPGAIALGSPWVDLAKTGDTFFTNNFVDNFQVSYDGYAKDAAILYANGRDFKDPMLSPIYGDFTGFPPAILTSGTRDISLSQTVKAHRKLRQSGVEAALQVFEALSHVQWTLNPDAPETREAFEEIARFFDGHMQR